MRIAILSAVIFLCGVVTPATAISPDTSARIRVTAEPSSTRLSGDTVIRVYKVFNRPAFKNRIGTAIVICQRISQRWTDCQELVRLGRGQIIARGMVPSAAIFRVLAITGGTGYYSNVGGEMWVQPVGSGQLIIINLIGQ